MVDKTGGAHCEIMIINVEYMLDDKTQRVSFTDEQFLIAAGCDWRTASKQLRMQFLKRQIKENNNFCYLLPK